MWALDRQPTYYAQGAYVPGYGTVGPGGTTLVMPVPVPIWETIALWVIAFGLVILFLMFIWWLCED